MAIARVQTKKGVHSTGYTFTVVLDSVPTNGNMLVAVIVLNRSASAPTVASVTSTGATWAKQTSRTSASGLSDIEIWAAANVQTASATITITADAVNLNDGVANVCEYSGVPPTIYLDKTAGNNNTGTATDTGTTATTTIVNELWVGASGAALAGGNQASPTNGFTLIDGVAHNSISCGYLEKIVSSTGAANSGTTVVSTTWFGCMATFKAPVITGVTRDSAGAALGGCTVWAFLASDKSYIGSETSDGSGNYTIYVKTTAACFIRAFKDGTPNVFGTTDDDLVGG